AKWLLTISRVRRLDEWINLCLDSNVPQNRNSIYRELEDVDDEERSLVLSSRTGSSWNQSGQSKTCLESSLEDVVGGGANKTSQRTNSSETLEFLQEVGSENASH